MNTPNNPNPGRVHCLGWMLVFAVSMAIVLVGCGQEAPGTAEIPSTPDPDATDQSSTAAAATPTLTAAPLQESSHSSSYVRDERSTTFVTYPGYSGDYLYRGDVQYPAEMEIGPDGYVYVADHNGKRITRISPDGEIEDLMLWRQMESWEAGAGPGPNDVAFGPDGSLYFADTEGIYRVDGPDKIVEVYSEPSRYFWINNLTFDNEGNIYFVGFQGEFGCLHVLRVSGESVQLNCSRAFFVEFDPAWGLIIGDDVDGIYILDPDTGERRPISTICGSLAVDGRGNLWSRGGVDGAHAYRPDGSRIQFRLTNSQYDLGTELIFGGGIAIDDQERIWIGAYNSQIVRLDPVNLEASIPSFEIVQVFPALEPRAIAVGPNEEVYVINARTFSLWRFDSPDVYQEQGNYEDRFRGVGLARAVGMAVDDAGNVYIGFPNGEIIRVLPNGEESHYAWVRSESMTFASDGYLYAVKYEPTFTAEASLVRILGPDIVETVITSIEGYRLGTGEDEWAAYVYVSPGPNGGLYICDLTNESIYFWDLTGEPYRFDDIIPNGAPGVFTSSREGTIYYLLHHNKGFMIEPAAEGPVRPYYAELYLDDAIDPWSIAVSTDGRTVYVGDSGTIIRVERLDVPMPGSDDILTRISETDGMVQVRVPAGSFRMGMSEYVLEDILGSCGDCDRSDFDSEIPLHVIALDAYWIDQTEVTNSMYALCVQDGVCDPPGSLGSVTRSAYYGEPEFADYPVIAVSWHDAKMYCEWAGRRLPTEAEWEKAARGTDLRIFPWGNEAPVGNQANFCDTNCFTWGDPNADDGFFDTSPVGTFPDGASPYGALDMAGNVWEWVSDWFAEDFYLWSGTENPIGPETYRLQRALRGGSWNNEALDIRVTYRIGFDPLMENGAIGFRCASSD